MNSIANLSSQQLRLAAKIKDQIASLEKELSRILGAPTQFNPAPRTRRKMSAAARAKIGAAQKARWAKAKGKRKMSAAARKKISVAAKARWAKIKAAKK